MRGVCRCVARAPAHFETEKAGVGCKGHEGQPVGEHFVLQVARMQVLSQAKGGLEWSGMG
jgi:hypothetical protein